jgi:hypothetical protein
LGINRFKTGEFRRSTLHSKLIFGAPPIRTSPTLKGR